MKRQACLSLSTIVVSLSFVLSQEAVHVNHTSSTSRPLLTVGEQQNFSSTFPPKNVSVTSDREIFERFKADPDYLEPYDPNVWSLPNGQLEFVRDTMRNDIGLFKLIVQDGIDKMSSFTPGLKMAWKYGKKLTGNTLSNLRKERKISPRVAPQNSFYAYLANLTDAIIERSGQIMKEKGYSKHTVDVKSMKDQIFNILDTIQRVTEKSPVGTYNKWNQLRIYKQINSTAMEPANHLEETADAAAKFRAIGYNNCVGVVRQLVRIFRLFARGSDPEYVEVPPLEV